MGRVKERGQKLGLRKEKEKMGTRKGLCTRDEIRWISALQVNDSSQKTTG